MRNRITQKMYAQSVRILLTHSTAQHYNRTSNKEGDTMKTHTELDRTRVIGNGIAVGALLGVIVYGLLPYLLPLFSAR